MLADAVGIWLGTCWSSPSSISTLVCSPNWIWRRHITLKAGSRKMLTSDLLSWGQPLMRKLLELTFEYLLNCKAATSSSAVVLVEHMASFIIHRIFFHAHCTQHSQCPILFGTSSLNSPSFALCFTVLQRQQQTTHLAVMIGLHWTHNFGSSARILQCLKTMSWFERLCTGNSIQDCRPAASKTTSNTQS